MQEVWAEGTGKREAPGQQVPVQRALLSQVLPVSSAPTYFPAVTPLIPVRCISIHSVLTAHMPDERRLRS